MPSYKYQPEDDYIWVNTDDIDLYPIRISLEDLRTRIFADYGKKYPGRPKLKNVPGYGRDPEDQYFQREEIPQRLIDLERKCRLQFRDDNVSFDRKEQRITNEYWDILDRESASYADEIFWLSKCWFYRLFGAFFMNHGKLTYITGDHWYFLNWWHLGDIRPEYRDRDRRWYLAQAWFMLDTTTFKDYDKKEGKPIPNDSGEYEMIDLGRRLFYGTNNVKSRRVGDTSKSQSSNTEFITRMIESHCGIIGDTAQTAENDFLQHFVKGFKRLPLFFKPLAARQNPVEYMLFESDDPYLGLGSRVTYSTTQDRGFYDGDKLQRLHTDEPGKLLKESVNKRHEVVKNCLSTGSGSSIFGFTYYTTTVDELEAGRGGDEFLKLANGSHWHKRNENGQTATGLVNLYFRASDGMQGFVGKFGESIEDTPTPEQAKFIGRKIGAREYLLNQRKQLERDRRIEELCLHKRQFPMSFREAFTPKSKNAYFRNDLIELRLNELMFDLDVVRRGNFHWQGDRDGQVIFIDDPEGKFFLSKMLSQEEANRKYMMDGQWYPMYPDRNICSVDTFRIEKVDSGRMSNGGICVRWKYDPQVDPPDKDTKDWLSARAIITYNYRPDTLEEFGEDVLMACVYTGALCYPENNQDNIIRYLKDRGYGGYLLYDVDINTGKVKNNPGFYSTAELKKKMFNLVGDDIAKNVGRNCHEDFLRECLAIRDIDDMTNYDLWAAYAGTLLGEQSAYGKWLNEKEDVCDTSEWLPMQEY